MERLETLLWRTFDGASARLLESLQSLLSEALAVSGAAGHELVFDLLERYTYLTRSAYDGAIAEIADYIAVEFDLNRTLLCATTADHQKDSAQAVLYDLATCIGLLGHTKLLTANRYDRAHKFAGIVDDIVLVDEFLGTGRSVIGRIRAISRVFSEKGIPTPRIHVVVIAGMDFGLRAVSLYASATHTYYALRPGIRGFSKGAAQHAAYASMDAFEDSLAPDLGGYLLPKLGDGQCEALYGRDRGNCPNSVLPMFWWPISKGGQSRSTPFTRVL